MDSLPQQRFISFGYKLFKPNIKKLFIFAHFQMVRANFSSIFVAIFGLCSWLHILEFIVTVFEAIFGVFCCLCCLCLFNIFLFVHDKVCMHNRVCMHNGEI